MSSVSISAGGIAVTPVRTPADRRRFLRLPWQIYDRAGPWVPPLLTDVEELLDPRRHPFHRHGEVELFLAWRDGRAAGRIAAIQNQAHLDVHGDGAGFFGFFESVDDIRVAGALLDAAEDWLRVRGLTLMRGPTNPSVNEEIGLLLDDYGGQPVIMMPYNPPYYVDLLEKSGLERVRTLYAFLADRRTRPTERQTRLAGRMLESHGISIRTARIKDAEREAAVIESIYNRAWEHLWGYVPMTHEEALYLTNKLKAVADERMILIAAVQGEPAAFTLAIPDYNQVLRHLNGRLTPLAIVKALYYRRRITRLRLLAMGVLKEHRRKGIEAILVREMVERAEAAGYQEMEISWILEDNLAAINILKNAGVPRYRSYGIFERPMKPATERR
jgi:GNAT superfamily N-acetyltransferase